MALKNYRTTENITVNVQCLLWFIGGLEGGGLRSTQEYFSYLTTANMMVEENPVMPRRMHFSCKPLLNIK